MAFTSIPRVSTLISSLPHSPRKSRLSLLTNIGVQLFILSVTAIHVHSIQISYNINPSEKTSVFLKEGTVVVI